MNTIKNYKKQCIKSVDLIQELIRYFNNNKLSDKTGGYLTVADLKGIPLFVTIIGEVSEDKAEKYFLFSHSKKVIPIVGENIMSSYQVRNPSEDIWAGSIKGEKFIYSFSGLTEYLDEICSITTSLIFGDKIHQEFFTKSRMPNIEKVIDLLYKLPDYDNIWLKNISSALNTQRLLNKMEV